MCEVIRAVQFKMLYFWDMKQCRMVKGYQRFERGCAFHLQGLSKGFFFCLTCSRQHDALRASRRTPCFGEIQQSMRGAIQKITVIMIFRKGNCNWGTALAQWLRCCATNRKVTDLIPADVSGFFIDIKSFRSHYGPGVDSGLSL